MKKILDNNIIPDTDVSHPKVEEFLLKVEKDNPLSRREFQALKRKYVKEYGLFNKAIISQTFMKMLMGNRISNKMKDFVKVKAVRSWSGDVNQSVVTKAVNKDGKLISCPYDCDYCPTQTKKMVLMLIYQKLFDKEDAVARGMSYFDIVKQFRAELITCSKWSPNYF